MKIQKMEHGIRSKTVVNGLFLLQKGELNTINFRRCEMAFWKALMVNLAVAAIWFVAEYEQYGELQWDRECDNIVFWIYFFILWYLFGR